MLIDYNSLMYILAFSSFIILTQSTCSSLCKTCIDKNSTLISYQCTSCPAGYFLSGQNCLNCDSYNSSQCTTSTNSTQSTGDIVIPIITFFLITISMCCCCRYICNRCREFNRSQARPPQLPVNAHSHILIVYQPPPAANSLPEVSMQQLEIQSKWKKADQRFNQKDNCVICLQDGVYLLTSCKHSFHANCIWQWSSKKGGSCPLCKSKNISPVKIFCRMCFESYYQIDLRLVERTVGEKRWKKCERCQQN